MRGFIGQICVVTEAFIFRACLHEGGGPQVGDITHLGGVTRLSPHPSCKRNQIKMRDYMDRRVTPPKHVTSPTWDPPQPCKQALRTRPLQAFTSVYSLKPIYITLLIT